ncbi:methylated-DNA--[protein]-cysteine S-methyltransferase [Komagataeibacter medellinensis]|uniref:Methylated-DNA--[protein]-cysteine S-methyltransferase n=1 Tax=Komagataeibacter medellinensis TaxID=1177712 RepID=A0ABQ6VQZ5_9PROT|nr:methylated-DNA--[protein]-cysteine S-methyltransferase [Komagataeibacter medellinensis]KAB8122345.1 methylated-DNA--[protein]-cysteine S-methyltransferase [Komagataeibacter medellinensis]
MKALPPRKAAVHAPMRVAVGQSSLGAMLVAMTDRGLAVVMLDDDAPSLWQGASRLVPDARLVQGDVEMNRCLDAVRTCIDAPWQPFGLPLDPHGTAFQQQVWQALQAIPYGTTMSYAGLAAHIGRPGAARAVAGACGANPLAIVIPCHRVIGRDGSLSGYRWGVQRKQRLLEMEQIARLERDVAI